MSLQGLISGSECAVPSNPLSQVLKHTEGDRSLQQDRVAGPSSSRLQHLPGIASVQAAEQDVAMARQFFGGQQASVTPSLTVPPPVHHNELARLHDMNGRPDLNQAWGSGVPQQPVFRNNAVQGSWASEFSSDTRNQFVPAPAIQQPGQQISGAGQRSYTNLNGSYNHSVPMNMYGSNLGTPAFYQGLGPTLYTVSDKGKGKARDADFEAAFVQAVASLRITDTGSSARITQLDDSSVAAEQVPEVKTNQELSEVWQHLQESDAPPPREDMTKWESELSQLMTAQREELDHDYSGAMQDAWESGLGEFRDSGVANPKFDVFGYPILTEYVFEQNNKYMNPSTSTRSPLSEAKALLEHNGSLSEAALLLEAAIQEGELGEGGYEAWILLGETRSMDEREELGMRALMEGVRRAEATGADGTGMLSLAISFTNESYDRASHHVLWRWLRARFPTFPISEDTEKVVQSHSTWDSHARLTDAFLALARQQYDQGIVDADVQIGLGVLFYNTAEYDRAKDCFESALSLRPQDYLLWNRLGSSLSNGNKPEEALGAYREALSLRPTYTRAIYNVGVACLNIGAHKEAVEHFLGALAMQETTGGGQTSDQLWLTLRRAFVQMGRNDLAELARPESRSKLDLFRKHGFDF
ncbi:TPR-like protein [Gyrodon lividus]|nr:TPR-like protein [Gyrodon lividus]